MRYSEPWIARPAYRPPAVEGDDPEISRNLPWYVWSDTGADAPAEILSVLSPGLLIPDPGRRIIATVSRHSVGEGEDHGEVARRIVECVNACIGIEHPEQWLKQVRSYLSAQRREDDRVASSLLFDART